MVKISNWLHEGLTDKSVKLSYLHLDPAKRAFFDVARCKLVQALYVVNVQDGAFQAPHQLIWLNLFKTDRAVVVIYFIFKVILFNVIFKRKLSIASLVEIQNLLGVLESVESLSQVQ